MRKYFVVLCLVSLLIGPHANAQTNTSSDITKPTIGGVTVGSTTQTTAVIAWTTNEAATSYVDFGPTDLYGNTLGDGTYVTSHSVTLLGLTAGTQYHFRVRSKDAAGNEATSTDTVFTSATATNVNTTVNSNTNTNANKNTNLNANKNANANLNANKNTNTSTNKNVNTNRNTNANKNTNLNANANTNTNLFNDDETTNVNTSEVNTNADVTNVNATPAESEGDGRTGLILILFGVLLLVGVVIFAWKKARQSPTIRP